MSTPMKLAVLGAGAVTSVGNSLPATSAAVRAGLNNFQDTQFEDELGEPIVGAALDLGRSASGTRSAGATKLGESLAWAIAEAVDSASIQLPLPVTVPLLFLGDETRPAPLVDAAHLCQRAIAPLFESPEHLHLQAFTGGEAACVDALQAAREFLARGAPFVVIAASDSWLRVADIGDALENQRVLDADSGQGFVPGEGAAALLIARDMASAPLQICGLGVAEEAATLLSGEPCHGKGLAQATRQALNESGWQPHDVHLRLSDVAGESYFAEELSSAWARLLREPQPQGHARLFPAASTGHVGCVFGPLMLAADAGARLATGKTQTPARAQDPDPAVFFPYPARRYRRACRSRLMATHVYANGNEIASKSADGSSRAAFPDVCHTPPATASPTPIKPFPPGVPIPYPNTCHAPDITNGSRTVFILGKEIALENHSYFSVSEGDDAATQKLAKGIISGAVKGRCYFQTWSPNVFVEGRAVARHLDMVSHNHKNPSNTPLFPYLSRGIFGGHDCRKEEKRIQKACSNGPKPKKPKKPKATEASANHWTRDFCTGLQFGANHADKADLRDELNDLLDNAKEQFGNLSEGAWSYLGSAAASGAGKLAARSGARVVVGAVAGAGVGLIGGPAAPATSTAGAGAGATLMAVVSAGDTVLTVVSGLWNLPENWAAANAAGDLFDEAKGLFEGLDSILDENGQLNLTDEQLADAVGEWQDMLAKINPCLRARKCSLVPHRNKTIPRNSGTNKVEPANQGGCCPGQQGHHLIPKAMMEGVDCPGYNDGSAPTVCVEGNRTNKGSHQRVHNRMDSELEKLLEKGRISTQGTLSMDDAVAAAVASHQAAFPLSRCRANCIKAQLSEYYKKLCPSAQVKAKLQDGNPVGSMPATDNNNSSQNGGRG